MHRRQFLASGSALALVSLSGCAQGLGYSLTEAIRRLLTLSSQRALARLMAPGGFYDSQVGRITLPDGLGKGGSLITQALLSTVLRDRLTKQVNRAAEKGAERAAPIIADAILSVSPEDAAALLKGGGPLATALLQKQMGSSLLQYMLPGVDEGLKLFDNEVVTMALNKATGIDFAGLRDDVTRKASDAIFAEMGREEVAIRADPQSTGDPILIAALTAL